MVNVWQHNICLARICPDDLQIHAKSAFGIGILLVGMGLQQQDIHIFGRAALRLRAQAGTMALWPTKAPLGFKGQTQVKVTAPQAARRGKTANAGLQRARFSAARLFTHGFVDGCTGG